MTPKRLAAAAALLAIPLALISVSLSAATSDDAPLPMQRYSASEIAAMAAAAPKGANPGVQMTNLIGDPTKPGLYTVRVP